MTETKWLNGRKPGDNVIVNFGERTERLRTVARVTATQIILAGEGCRWRKKTNLPVGHRDAWDFPHLYEPTPERLTEMEHRRLLQRLSNVPRAVWLTLDLATLKHIDDLVFAAGAKGAANG